MRRRDLIAAIAGCAALGPVASEAQQPEHIRRVGVLMAFAENDPLTRAMMTAFAQALGRSGWVEGKNVRIDYRFAAGDPVRFKSYAAELISLSPDAILASTPPSVLALRQQTQTIPIVFVLVTDPVGLGLAASFARPGANITGFSFDSSIVGKWPQLLKEIAPDVTRAAVIFNPDTNTTANPLMNRSIEAAAPSFGIAVTLAPVHDDAEIEEAALAQARELGGSLIALPDSFNVAHGAVIAAAATRGRLPLVGPPPLVAAGGLMSYLFDPLDLYVQAATYVDRILKGSKAADLPVQQPTKISLIINLKTATALNLVVPQSLLAQADEVIE